MLGCPAEEGLCGKADMIRLKAFDGVDVAMMAHPSQSTLAKPKYVSMSPYVTSTVLTYLRAKIIDSVMTYISLCNDSKSYVFLDNLIK